MASRDVPLVDFFQNQAQNLLFSYKMIENYKYQLFDIQLIMILTHEFHGIATVKFHTYV